MIEPEYNLSLKRQCELVSLNRSSFYVIPKQVRSSKYDEIKVQLIEIWNLYPFMGSRRLRKRLEKKGYRISRNKVQKLMKELGIKAIGPKVMLSIPNKEHKVYPYLLRGVRATENNQIWSTDITYIKLGKSNVYST